MSEEIESKSGPELFKELLRLYKTAEVEDYYKMGQWQDERMRIDIGLLEAHRKEGGAPDAPDLEEVTMPDNLPGATPKMAVGLPAAGGLAVPAANALSGGPVAELRLIALFVTKWGLDAQKSKLLLAKQTPTRRKFIIENFKGSGGEVQTELETYIKKCEADGSWDKVSAPTLGSALTPRPAALPGAAVQPRPVLNLAAAIQQNQLQQQGAAHNFFGQVKRPLLGVPGANPLFDPNKRPALGLPAAANPALAAARGPPINLAARLAAIRPQGSAPAPGLAGIGALAPGGPRPIAPRPGLVPPQNQGGLIRNLLQKF